MQNPVDNIKGYLPPQRRSVNLGIFNGGLGADGDVEGIKRQDVRHIIAAQIAAVEGADFLRGDEGNRQRRLPGPFMLKDCLCGSDERGKIERNFFLEIFDYHFHLWSHSFSPDI